MASIHIARAQQHLGSFGENEVREGIRTQRFLASDLVWREGMETWKPLGEMAPQWGIEATPPPLDNVRDAHDSELPPDTLEGVEPAWEEREKIGLFPALSRTLKATLFHPAGTFSRMKHTGGLTSPLLFAVGLNTTLHTIFGLLSLFALFSLSAHDFQTQMQFLQQLFQQFQGAGQGLSPTLPFPLFPKATYEWIIIGSILLWPTLSILGYFLGAGLLHLSFLMVGGTKHPFESTFRTTCYLCGSFNAIAVFSNMIAGGALGGLILMIAFLGYILWYSYAAAVAFREAQGISTWRFIITATIANIAGCCVLLVVGMIVSPFLMNLLGMTVKMPH